MDKIPLSDRSGLSTPRLASLTRELATRHTLADVLAWARDQTPPAEVADAITQDEFTHDVVLAAGAPPDRIFLVFDTT